MDVHEIEGAIAISSTTRLAPIGHGAASDDTETSDRRYDFGFRLEFTRGEQHIRIGRPVARGESPERLGSILAAVAVKERSLQGALFDRMQDRIHSELQTSSAWALSERWTGLRPMELFVSDSIVADIEVDYTVLLCAVTDGSTEARLIETRARRSGLQVNMHLLDFDRAEAACGDLQDAFANEPARELVFREPVEIEDRVLRITLVDQTSSVMATLPVGARFRPALQEAGEDLAEPDRSNTTWVQPPGSPATPPSRFDPDSDLDVSRYVGRFEITQAHQSFGENASREERVLGDVVAAWMFTEAPEHDPRATIEAELGRQLRLLTIPLSLGTVQELIASVRIDGAFAVMCVRGANGVSAAEYVIEGHAGAVVAATAACASLHDEFPP